MFMAPSDLTNRLLDEFTDLSPPPEAILLWRFGTLVARPIKLPEATLSALKKELPQRWQSNMGNTALHGAVTKAIRNMFTTLSSGKGSIVMVITDGENNQKIDLTEYKANLNLYKQLGGVLTVVGPSSSADQLNQDTALGLADFVSHYNPREMEAISTAVSNSKFSYYYSSSCY